MKHPHLSTADRTYHIVDIENLCQSGAPSSQEVHWALADYAKAVSMGETDQGRAAMSYSQEKNHLYELPHQLRWVVSRSGPDAADNALLQDCDPGLLSRCFKRVVIATGDHRFAGLAAELRTRGVEVVVAGITGSISGMLAAQAERVIELPTPIREPTLVGVA